MQQKFDHKCRVCAPEFSRGLSMIPTLWTVEDGAGTRTERASAFRDGAVAIARDQSGIAAKLWTKVRIGLPAFASVICETRSGALDFQAMAKVQERSMRWRGG